MWNISTLVKFFLYSGSIIEYIGLILVVVFVVGALLKLPMKKYTMESIRVGLAKKIIFALELIIAGDIVLATVATEMDDILKLGGIVFIRVVLGYSLRKDLIR
ncbi:DUF1622 domain-containing protein [Patescibacteria group bacterium]|nr:DUF1622 domain-containing protein [Patescibacteria group bacterium]MBU1895251.1 DUF1622 domain-containing protein [Patescibacteria group bacterium]